MLLYCLDYFAQDKDQWSARVSVEINIRITP
jgi:hypothetical protein